MSDEPKNPRSNEMEFVSHSSRNRILAAALKLFVEQGYFNTNIPDLSRESKCSVGSIYHHFKNKEEVARALYSEGLSALREVLEKSTAHTKDSTEMIRAVVKIFMEFSEVNKTLSKYLWLCRHNEFMTGIIHHPTRIGFDAFGKKLTRSIKQGIKDGHLQPLKANIIWTILFGIPASYVKDWLEGYNKEKPTAVADTIADLCLKALKK